MFKTIATVVTIAAMVIASFYTAYLIVILGLIAVVGTIAYYYHSQTLPNWLNELFEDDD